MAWIEWPMQRVLASPGEVSISQTTGETAGRLMNYLESYGKETA
jgi:hypothetical protein